ncbi:hypothetical protein [Mobiluncus mulieris]|uniref:hypothetical protein n=1 Tax=Mobiluncus mulieris TaxID=2052 RepID=UPI0020931D1F|nr:hypothetical protein [Mobiluncus mulieris]
MIQPQGRTPAVRVNVPDVLEDTAIRLIEKQVEVLGLGTRDDGVTLKTIDAQRIEAMSDSIRNCPLMTSLALGKQFLESSPIRFTWFGKCVMPGKKPLVTSLTRPC